MTHHTAPRAPADRRGRRGRRPRARRARRLLGRRRRRRAGRHAPTTSTPRSRRAASSPTGAGPRSAEAQVAAFEEEYPNVDVKLVNAGTGNDQYTKLQNAIKAGSGAPDVAQIEYYALPQFALAESLVDLSRVRLRRPRGPVHRLDRGARCTSTAASTACRRTPAPWRCSTTRTSSTSTASRCRPPGTSTSHAAEKLHAADPTTYITNDTGDAGFTTSMIWQAGGRPFSVDGTDVTIDLADEGSQKWADIWNQLVEEDLLSHRLPAGATSGTRASATARSPRW